MCIQRFLQNKSLGLENVIVVGNTERHKTVLSHELENREGHFSHHFRILSRFLHSTTYHPPIVLTLQATFQANIILLSDASPLQYHHHPT